MLTNFCLMRRKRLIRLRSVTLCRRGKPHFQGSNINKLPQPRLRKAIACATCCGETPPLLHACRGTIAATESDRHLRQSLAEFLQLTERQIFQRFALTNGFHHSFTHNMVRLAERYAFRHQIIRQFSSVGVTLLRRFGNADVSPECRPAPAPPYAGSPASIERVEQTFFVFLHIFVVSQRQTFQRHHHAG